MLAPRILPALNPITAPYWTGGARGQLLIERCSDCGRWQHPPAGSCADCGGEATAEPVSGSGTVFSFTVNEQQYHPEVPPPYVIAIVELVEQRDLRVPTNLVGDGLDRVSIDAPVTVEFEQHGEVFVPVFRLVGEGAA